MKNKGFTLIELLAVLTILSVILLIAVFSVSSVISNSKKNLQDTQMEQILKAAEYYNSKEGTDDDIQVVSVKTLTEKGYLKNDEVKDPKTGKIIDGVVLIKYNGKKYSYKYREENICIADANDTSTTPGTKYECEVKDGTKYTFYVLSIEGDKINLIMNSNICEDGTLNYTQENNYCNYAWYDDGDNPVNTSNDINTKGPLTLMPILYNATKEWNNVPNMELSYLDEGNNYGEITTTLNGIYITEKGIKAADIEEIETPTMQYTSGNPLKARLPKLSEMISDAAKCAFESSGSCESWLVENLKYYNVENNKYSVNSSNVSNAISNVTGYWLMDTPQEYSDRVYDIVYYGYRGSASSSLNDRLGIRPVITVASSFLSSNSNN